MGCEIRLAMRIIAEDNSASFMLTGQFALDFLASGRRGKTYGSRTGVHFRGFSWARAKWALWLDV